MTGTPDLSDGELVLSFAAGVNPRLLGDIEILTAGNVLGEFGSVLWPAEWSGDVAYSPAAVTLTNVVPEPAALTAIIAAAAAVLRRRRRR